MVSAVHLRHRGLTDQEQLTTATENHRILVTHNIRDFVLLHRHSASRHYGILVSNQEPLNMMLRRLLHFLFKETASSAQGNLFWLSDYEPPR